MQQSVHVQYECVDDIQIIGGSEELVFFYFFVNSISQNKVKSVN